MEGKRARSRLRLTTAGIVAIVVTCVAVPLSSAGAAGRASNDGGVLRIADAMNTATGGIHLDPAKSTVSEQDYPYQVLFYDALLRRTSSGGLEPDLATKATIVDPSTIDVELRSGVKFSDGTPFDAQAVKTGVERTLAAATTQYPAEFKDLQSVTVTGPLSLRLALSQPVAGAFYPLLGGQPFFIPSPKAIDDGVDLDTHPVGAGAFVLKSFEPEQQLVTEANPRYFAARNVKLGGVEFIAAQPGAPTVSLLKAGGADLAIVSGQDADTLRSSGFTVKTQGADDQMYWMPLCKTAKPLDQAEVRQALNYALNRDELNQALFSGAGEPQWALWPSKNVLFPKNLANFYKYDPKKAKQLLKAAGYPNGFETTVIVSTSPQVQLMAQVAQADWAKIGVKLNIVNSNNFVQDLYTDHKGDLGINPSIRSGLLHLTGPFVPGSLGNLCDYSSPKLNAIADQLKALPPDAPEAKALWQQAQDFVVKDQALGVFGIFGPVVSAWDPKAVRNVQIVTGPTNSVDYWSAVAPK